MKDFTLNIYKKLLETIISKEYTFQTMQEYILSPKDKCIIMRHDVDRKPKNALRKAKLENELGIKATYYFRIGKESNLPKIIKQIAKLGHEIGYHYEDLAVCSKQKSVSSKDELLKIALIDFEKNLEYFRKFYPVKTICMHGSPLSRWDNRDLWEKYDYRNYGIICEPYFDLDFNEIFYITDAGHSWNNEKVSIRDKVNTSFKYKLKSTNDIIKLLKSKNF